MLRQPFVPARSSRHRVAVLALYRSLLRTASSVPLPKDLHPEGHRHPVAKILRTRFAKNKPLTSLRLIYDSMTAGYKFLTLMTKGQIEKSPEHSEILRHLQKRNETAGLSRLIHPRKKGLPPSKQWRNPPLLTKVSAPGEFPKYEPTVRPLPKTAFVGERKVPVFGHTAELLSFLRIKKPQPKDLSRSIGAKTSRFRRTVHATKRVDTELVSAAASEDLWDGIMHRLLHEKGDTVGERRDGPLESFRFSTTLTKAWWEMKLLRFNEDWIARSEAISKLVEQERALAKGEKQSGVGPTDPEVAKQTLDQILAEYRRKQTESGREKEENGTASFEDPFASPRWLKKVERLEIEELEQNGRRQGRQNKKVREFFGEDEHAGTQRANFYENW
ncbi:hypothetical protein FLAG1_04589 [Fusarium langsethiae]|uniref:Complex 1 LYR protein domain-containing protein n=1 Tax=Fusarium langsethiae TaxID=179993 RepID=A0A0M9EZ57_FUSLA|nr:hypothetical protein FLAG1_04589 [Fusarium langsethiae]GKU03830.1 unnamed protein product [Fusarium langsethiae]GKU19065.1 unnamed protein product [Fusarium langsethiae]